MNNEPTQEELESEIAELEHRLSYKKKQYKRLKLINHNGRYFLSETGDILELIPTVNNEYWEKSIKQGNTFKTVEDAKKERDRRALLYEFNQFRDECNDGWSPDWSSFDEVKWFIGFQRGAFETCANWSLTNFTEFGFFENKKGCEKAINKFGDRIKKLFVDQEVN